MRSYINNSVVVRFGKSNCYAPALSICKCQPKLWGQFGRNSPLHCYIMFWLWLVKF